MKKYTLKVKRDKKKSSSTISLGGQLNVSTMTDIYTEFKKAIKDAKSVTTNIKDVEDADLTLMQMLKSFEIECKKNNIAFKTSFELPEDTNHLYERAGLFKLINVN